jgi:hypothetical protein
MDKKQLSTEKRFAYYYYYLEIEVLKEKGENQTSGGRRLPCSHRERVNIDRPTDQRLKLGLGAQTVQDPMPGLQKAL